MADVYNYARTIEVPAKSQDPIAHITLQRFNEAVMWQSQELVGGKSLRTVLQDCYDQFNGNLSCADQEIADEIGVDAYVNITAMKVGIVQSFLMETLTQAGALPWTVQPTPVPTLSEAGKYEVLSQIKQEIYQNNYTGDLTALVQQLKSKMLRKEYEYAKTAASNMEKLMTDQCLEGGWNNAMFAFTTDFCVYPFAVLQGPIPVRRPRLQWVGDKLTTKLETFYEFRSVSPWDFWYSPDSPDTQRGTGIFIRQRWTRQKLLEAAKMDSYIQDNITKILKEVEGYDYKFNWMSENPDQPDDQLARWANCSATIDVLIHYGYFSGRELREYGITHVEDTEFYNATVTVVNNHTIQVVIPNNPNLHDRPIYTTSFYKTHDRIPSFGIPQRIRDVERCYLTVLRYLVMNAASASGPITEADYSRLSKYMSDDDIAKLIPNTVYLADGMLGSNNPALRFYSIPSVMGEYMRVLEYFMALADKISNVPAALHGTAQGSGANRTFRGAAMLQGNATKAIQAAMGNIDHFVFALLGKQLYNYNMLYSSDPTIKGDCKILAQGASGLLQKEIDRQASYEILQMVGAAGQQLAQLPSGVAIMEWALKNVLGNMGVPKELLSDSAPGSPNVMPEVPGMGEAQATAAAAAPAQDVALPPANTIE